MLSSDMWQLKQLVSDIVEIFSFFLIGVFMLVVFCSSFNLFRNWFFVVFLLFDGNGKVLLFFQENVDWIDFGCFVCYCEIGIVELV